MKRTLIAATLVLVSGQAHATCEDAWYLRNLAFDRAGYCFGSALGEAVFDNSDCTTKSPTLLDWDKRLVDETKQYEANMGCKIDTTANQLESTLIGKLDFVDLLPSLAPYESICIGFSGPDLPMRSDLGIVTSYPTGDVVAGDTVRFRFHSADGFEFVETDLGAGWIPAGSIAPENCRQFAG